MACLRFGQGFPREFSLCAGGGGPVKMPLRRRSHARGRSRFDGRRIFAEELADRETHEKSAPSPRMGGRGRAFAAEGTACAERRRPGRKPGAGISAPRGKSASREAGRGWAETCAVETGCGGAFRRAKKAFPGLREKAFHAVGKERRPSAYTSKSISRSSLVRDFQESCPGMTASATPRFIS